MGCPSGYARCECGQLKARHARQCRNCAFKRPVITQPNDPTIRHIPLTKGQIAIVDSKNYDRVSQYRYYVRWNDNTQSYYAVRTVYIKGQKRRTSSLHRDIMGLGIDDPRTVDHAFHNTLDNREIIDGKVNLRIANEEEQAWNRQRPSSNSSGYKGVSRKGGNWAAHITASGKHIFLGVRSTAEAAWRELYVPAAMAYHGEFANVGSDAGK